MPGDNIPESMGEDFSESVGEDISEQPGAIIPESVGGFPRNQHQFDLSKLQIQAKTASKMWNAVLAA
ncbi:MAG TPA: hypothetical protein VMV54_04520 [Acidocella sp.]|nr:hypothetical protein [Acidocella sp.]